MNRATIILFLAMTLLACRSLRLRRKTKLKWFQRLTGTQKIFGALAFLAVLAIMLNPEFLALGFLGDTAFFDMLILALSLQLHTHVLRASRWSFAALKKSARWAGIPSPGFRYLLAVSTIAIAAAVSFFHKTLQRIL